MGVSDYNFARKYVQIACFEKILHTGMRMRSVRHYDHFSSSSTGLCFQLCFLNKIIYMGMIVLQNQDLFWYFLLPDQAKTFSLAKSVCFGSEYRPKMKKSIKQTRSN